MKPNTSIDNSKLFRLFLNCSGFDLHKDIYTTISFHLLSLHKIKTIDRDKTIHRELFLKNIFKKCFPFTDWKKYKQGKDLTIPTRSYFSQILPISIQKQ